MFKEIIGFESIGPSEISKPVNTSGVFSFVFIGILSHGTYHVFIKGI